MRAPIFMITAMSCMVICAGFISRGNYVVAAVIGLVGVFYIARVFVRLPKADASTTSEEATDDDTAQLRKELEQTLIHVRRNMVMTRAIFVLLAAGMIIVFFFNQAFAWGLSPFTVFFAYLFYKNARAVHLLETNL